VRRLRVGFTLRRRQHPLQVLNSGYKVEMSGMSAGRVTPEGYDGGRREGAESAQKMLTRMLVTSYKLPCGLTFQFAHTNGCRSEGRDESWNGFIRNSDPRTVSELNTVVRGLMNTSGCDGCSMIKDTTMGILFDHSQNSEYIPSARSTQDDYVSVTSPNPSAASWPSSIGLGSIPDSEKALYGKKFKLDRSSDSDYAPPPSRKTVKTLGSRRDVPMALEDGKDTEGSGVGNSKWAVIPETQETLPETVGYTPSRSQTEAMLEELAKVNTPEAVPAVEDDTPMTDNDGGNMEKRMDRVEKRILDLLNEVDELKDKVLDLEIELRMRDKPETKKEATTEPAIPLPRKDKGKQKADTKKADKVKAVEQPARTIPPNVPKYESGMTYSKVAADEMGTKEFSIVRGRKRFEKKKLVVVGVPPRTKERERHLKIRFNTPKGTVTKLPKGINPETIRNGLNECLGNLNERKAYFSVARLNKFGDVLLALRDTKVEDIHHYLTALGEELENMGLKDFRFERDAEKVKIFVGMVPLARAGKGTWSPSDWDDVNAFRSMANDIELSNMGITLAAKPSWVGKLEKFHKRKQSTAGILLVVEKSPEVKAMMAKETPRMIISGKPRICRVWREENNSVLCTRCMKIGHIGAGCIAKPVCKYCRKEHLSTDHKCNVTGCVNTQAGCKHYQIWCMQCESNEHMSGHEECPAIRRNSSSPSRMGPNTPVVSDPTSATGVADSTRNRERNKTNTGRGTPMIEQQSRSNVTKPVGNALVPTPRYDLRKKEHGTVVPGIKITEYEKIGEVDGVPVVRGRPQKVDKGKGKARPSSVPTRSRETDEDGSQFMRGSYLFGESSKPL